MHHPTDNATDTGPAGLTLPLALVAFLAERTTEQGAGNAGKQPRAAELRTDGGRRSRAARRRATAVRG
ncbi:hypothetical protein AB0N93_25050 [Streptomyces sp. NPDC091267]|uniref:hypothetical protein n=1 Tax=Streptomyces sp. NPDC091267 TaxID=3155195 RepID=UPI00344000F9